MEIFLVQSVSELQVILTLLQIKFFSFLLAKLFPQLCSCNGNGLVHDINFFKQLWTTKGSQFSVMSDIIKDIANDKKGDIIVNDRFAHKPDGLLVTARNEVGARLYFHRRLWFCPGGCLVGGWGCLVLEGVCSGGSAPRGVPGGDPPPGTATAAGGTHPTGMHSCLRYVHTYPECSYHRPSLRWLWSYNFTCKQTCRVIFAWIPVDLARYQIHIKYCQIELIENL